MTFKLQLNSFLVMEIYDEFLCSAKLCEPIGILDVVVWSECADQIEWCATWTLSIKFRVFVKPMLCLPFNKNIDKNLFCFGSTSSSDVKLPFIFHFEEYLDCLMYLLL